MHGPHLACRPYLTTAKKRLIAGGRTELKRSARAVSSSVAYGVAETFEIRWLGSCGEIHSHAPLTPLDLAALANSYMPMGRTLMNGWRCATYLGSYNGLTSLEFCTESIDDTPVGLPGNEEGARPVRCTADA